MFLFTRIEFITMIANVNKDPKTRDKYRNFVESERNFEQFGSGFIALSDDGSILTTQAARPISAAKAIALGTTNSTQPVYFGNNLSWDPTPIIKREKDS